MKLWINLGAPINIYNRSCYRREIDWNKNCNPTVPKLIFSSTLIFFYITITVTLNITPIYVLKVVTQYSYFNNTQNLANILLSKIWFTQLISLFFPLSSIMNSPLLFSFVMYTNMADMSFVISISGDRTKTNYSSQIVNVTIFVFFRYFIWRYKPFL